MPLALTISQIVNFVYLYRANAFINTWMENIFYSNEGNEPIHVHTQKGDMECKFWLNIDTYEIIEAFSYNISPSSRREIRKIIFEHFDYIVSEWNAQFKK